MKIAVFTDTYAQINGVAVTIDELVRYARARGLALDVFTHVAGPDSVEELGSVRVFRFRMLAPVRINEGLSLDLRFHNRRILARMRRERYDLVHFEAHGTMAVAAKSFARRLGIPVIGSYNTDIPSYIGPYVESALPWLGRRITRLITALGERGAWAMSRRLFGGCDLVLAPSDFTRAALERHLGQPVALFPRGVDPAVFSPAARRELARERPVSRPGPRQGRRRCMSDASRQRRTWGCSWTCSARGPAWRSGLWEPARSWTGCEASFPAPSVSE